MKHSAGGLAVVLCLFASCAPTVREEEYGGWLLVGTQPLEASDREIQALVRPRLGPDRTVVDDVLEYRYLGDDCMLFAVGQSRRSAGVVCGDRQPVALPEVDAAGASLQTLLLKVSSAELKRRGRGE